jgi:FkbM family methyltransferase
MNFLISLKQLIRISLSEFSRFSPNFVGKQRFLRYVDPLLKVPNELTKKTVDSVNYELNTTDVIDFRLFYLGITEKSVLNYLKKSIVNQTKAIKEVIMLDIGANIGSVSLPLITTHPNLKIYAFEPSPAVFSRLTQNVNLNPDVSDRIVLNNIALSNVSGSVDFFVSNNENNSGVGSLGKMHNTLDNGVTVESKKGDDLIDQKIIPEPDLIKIDVEGFEAEVLEGLTNFLKRSRGIKIIFENEPYRVDEREKPGDLVINFLYSLGFSLYLLQDDGSVQEYNEKMLDTHCDFVALN